MHQCIMDALDGLSEGLSHFSGPSRAAAILALTPGDSMRVFDPRSLLSGHEPRFRELFVESEAWRNNPEVSRRKKQFSPLIEVKNLELAGLVSHGGQSGSVYYQMWFTEHHPDMCSVGPTERWLEHAAWRFSHDIANEKELYTGISGNFLREYATHAVRDYIVDEMNILLGWDADLRVYPMLDAILGISRTREEGAWPRGELIFVEPSALSRINFVARFPKPEAPVLENLKHVRKLLLTVERSYRKLVSDGRSILGIATEHMPDFGIIADFRGGHGFLRLNKQPVCSFSDGSFKSTIRKARLFQLEEALLETNLDPAAGHAMFKIVSRIVHGAESLKYGCTIVIDLNDRPVEISGQRLEEPLDLQWPDFLELSKSLAKVDGALQLGKDLKLHAFACLLDGRAIPGEDRARGARYNSALRFTAGTENILIVVVSSDRPVSIIQDGVERSAYCPWSPVSQSISEAPTLEEWIEQGRA